MLTESATRTQIFNEAICISFNANPFVLSSFSYDKIVEQTGFLDLGGQPV